MKVLLIKAVKGLGKEGDVKEVANGYGGNYLIPRGLAVAATPGIIKEFEQKKQVEAGKQKREENTAESLAERLQGVVLTFTARAGEQGKLFGSITAADIATGLEMETGHVVDKRKVVLEQPIRELGRYTVPIKLMANIAPEVTVVVQSAEE